MSIKGKGLTGGSLTGDDLIAERVEQLLLDDELHAARREVLVRVRHVTDDGLAEQTHPPLYGARLERALAVPNAQDELELQVE